MSLRYGDFSEATWFGMSPLGFALSLSLVQAIVSVVSFSRNGVTSPGSVKELPLLLTGSTNYHVGFSLPLLLFLRGFSLIGHSFFPRVVVSAAFSDFVPRSLFFFLFVSFSFFSIKFLSPFPQRHCYFPLWSLPLQALNRAGPKPRNHKLPSGQASGIFFYPRSGLIFFPSSNTHFLITKGLFFFPSSPLDVKFDPLEELLAVPDRR